MRNETRKLERLQTAPTFHSRAIKRASSHRVKKPNFEQAASYRNQLLGIERLMARRLKDNEEFYRNSDERKRDILLDALEDVADANLGFEDQIRRVISTWRKPYTRDLEIELMESEHAKHIATENLQTLRTDEATKQAEIAELESEIADYETEISALEDAIREQRSRLFMASDLFARERVTSQQIRRLQFNFDDMFAKARETEVLDDTDELIQMKKDNAFLRKELARKQYEVEIAAQITKKLAMLTKHQFE